MLTRNDGAVTTDTKGIKRYNLALPEKLYTDLQTLADTEHTTVVELIRRFVKLGLTVATMEHDDTGELVLRRDGKEQVIKLLL